jgi:hypothetical protein
MRNVISIAALLALSACGGTIVQDRPVTVKVPVTVPCVSGERPAAVSSLKTNQPDWYGLSVKQKAELAAAQALRHKSYGEAENAVTSACT